MSQFKYYFNSMRVRTIPLSLSGVIVGIGLSVADYNVNPLAAVLVALTAALLQMLSNVSNEYGDYTHGTDRADRLGPHYSSGHISELEFRRLIGCLAVLCCISGLAMIYVSFGSLFSLESIMLILLGAMAIAGAIKYTVGKNPYGYRGLGDISVFIFFGLVSVLGTFFVLAHEIPSWFLLFPAAAIGCFSVGVLNVNNIRDIESDARTRVTTAIRMGERGAKVYHTALIVGGWSCLLFYVVFCRMFYVWHYLFVLTLPLFAIHTCGVWRHRGRSLDKYLPMLVISTFILAVLFAVGFTAYLWC